MAKTTIIYASKDTFVCSAPNSTALNFGKEGNLIIDGTSKIFVYFDLSSLPSNAIITAAKLRLYLYNSYSPDTIITIKKLDSAFYEYTVNADTAPASSILDSNDTNLKKITSSHINKFVTFNNLTNTVTSWHWNFAPNYGFELSSSENSLLSFFSRDYNENKLCPNLEIEYTIELHDMPTLETEISSETISLINTNPFITQVFDTSRALSFTYFICNTITDPTLPLSPHDISVALKTCDTPNGTFECINTVTISSDTTKVIEVPSINKYVCLSINGFENTNVTIDITSKSLPIIPISRIRFCKIVDDIITLTMTAPLISDTTAPDDFTITLPEYFDDVPLIKIVEATISKLTVKLRCSPNQLFFPNATLSYIGINKEVFNFTKKIIDIDLVAIHISEEISPEPSGVETTIYNASKLESFTYSIDNTSPIYYVHLKILQSNTRDAIPTVVNDFIVPHNSFFKIDIPKNYKYVHLSVFNDDTLIYLPPVTILTDYLVSPNFIPSTMQSVAIIESGTKLLLTLTKPLNEITTKQIQDTVFTLTSNITAVTNLSLKVTALATTNTTAILTLTPPIPLDIILERKSSDYIDITYKATDATYLSGDNGDVLNFSNYPITLNLEKVTITETFVSSTNTSIYSMEKKPYFDYVITNNSSEFDITITLLGSTTVNGTFTTIDGYSPLSITKNTSRNLTISTSTQYICLSIHKPYTVTNTDSIVVVATYGAMYNNITSTVSSIEILAINSNSCYIILHMTKALYVNQVDPAAFSIPAPAYFPPITSIEITADTFSVRLCIAVPLPQDAKFTVKYTATGTNDLNGINGFVDNFSFRNYN